ncbi:MAG: four helix bundle protein [Candidatus Omnitrophica bacterium]|nr:four helix bundle protein [Candidatus Omnitrophota bacterium]
MKNFRDLNIWILGKQIILHVYDVTKNFPPAERFGLASQMQRAAVSIPSNIAEGFNRFQNNEYRRFLYIALGSCAELETQVEISFDLKYISEEIRNCLIEKIDHESRMITTLIKRL